MDTTPINQDIRDPFEAIIKLSRFRNCECGLTLTGWLRFSRESIGRILASFFLMQEKEEDRWLRFFRSKAMPSWLRFVEPAPWPIGFDFSG